MIRRPPRSTQSRSSAASDVYKRQNRHGPGGPDAHGRRALPIGSDGILPVGVLDHTGRHSHLRVDIWHWRHVYGHPRGDIEHLHDRPSPVSYTHLTLPTIY